MSVFRCGLPVIFALIATSCAAQPVPGCSDVGIQKTVLERGRPEAEKTGLLNYYDLTLVDIRTDGTGQDGATMCSASGHFEIKPDLSKSDLDDLARLAQGRGVQKSLTVPVRLHYEVLKADNGNILVQTH